MHQLHHDPEICMKCDTVDCLMRCQYVEMSLEEAKKERLKILRGEDSDVLEDCATCYACEEYCPNGNHPFYLIVDRQEEKGVQPVPSPLTRQQLAMMKPSSTTFDGELQEPVVSLCAFPMLQGSIRGKLFEGVSTVSGTDIFCNIMWLHFAKNSAIRERLPQAIDNLWNRYLRPNEIDEVICFHDECYGTYTKLAPAYGIDVPFKSIHLFEYLTERLDALRDKIHPLNARVAYQRPCSSRLIPETQHWVDDIFERIGAKRIDREYDRQNALCCTFPLQAQQRDMLADEIQKRNIDDMKAIGATYCVFNCPACMSTLSDLVAEEGITPILMSDLCQIALGE